MHAAATAAQWRERAQVLTPEGRAFIDGAFVSARSGKTFADLSPIDGRRLADVAAGDAADIDAAVVAARGAFEQRIWADEPPAERKRVLLRFAERVEAATQELALLETLDVGKPIRDSLYVDVPATVRCLRWYAEAIDKIYDQVAPTGPAVAGTDYTRAGRRGGRHRAVELSDDHGRLEDRPDPGGR